MPFATDRVRARADGGSTYKVANGNVPHEYWLWIKHAIMNSSHIGLEFVNINLSGSIFHKMAMAMTARSAQYPNHPIDELEFESVRVFEDDEMPDFSERDAEKLIELDKDRETSEHQDVGTFIYAIQVNDALTMGKLTVYNCLIGPKGAYNLWRAMAKNRSVLDLTLDRCIGFRTSKYIARLVRDNTNVISLSLCYNDFSDPAMVELLADGLVVNTSIRSLALRSNGIGIGSAKYIARIVQHNKYIEHLDISVNKLGDDGAWHIGNALAHNTTLRRLDISTNGIGWGAEDIFSGAFLNKTLQSLVYTSNPVGAEICTSIAGYISRMTALTHLTMTLFNVDADDVPDFVDGISTNTSITSYDVTATGDCPGFGRIQTAMQNAARRNKNTKHN